MGTRSLQTRPALRTSRSILPLTLNTEVESLLPVSSEEVTNQVISTGIHTSSVNTGEPNYSEPSEVGFPIRKKLCQCEVGPVIPLHLKAHGFGRNQIK